MSRVHTSARIVGRLGLGAIMAVAVLGGCVTSRTVRIAVFDAESHQPAAHKPFLFFEETDRMDKPPKWFSIDLDEQGEARLRLPRAEYWARLDDGSACGATVTPADLDEGATLRLYGPPPSATDTNVYPSKYVLKISSPR